MAMANIYADLPRILYVLDRNDMGEDASCPHCGALGRYVYSFLCEDGSRRAAMAGCFKQFPRHPFAADGERLMKKQDDYRKKGWTLPSWDLAILDTIDAYADGDISEYDAADRIGEAKRQAAIYRSRRFGGR